MEKEVIIVLTDKGTVSSVITNDPNIKVLFSTEEEMEYSSVIFDDRYFITDIDDSPSTPDEEDEDQLDLWESNR